MHISRFQSRLLADCIIYKFSQEDKARPGQARPGDVNTYDKAGADNLHDFRKWRKFWH